MRFVRLAVALSAVIAASSAAHAGADTVPECKSFFQKFQTCVDALEGEVKDEATIFLKTLRGTVGMSDDLNRGDPMLTGMMCGIMMEEAKKDADIAKFKCQW